MKKMVWLPVLLGVLGASGRALAQDGSPEEERLRGLFEERRAAWNAPGLVYGVLRGDDPPITGGLGVASVETGAPMDPALLVSVASVSKLVTAATALVLAAEGVVDLAEPIGRHLPELSPGLAALTLEQLLSHTAGLGEATPRVPLSARGELAPVCERMTDAAFITEPGRTWGYTNTAYVLAGCVIEAAAGEPFDQVVGARVFEPLGMARSTFSPRMAMTYPHAQGHDTRRDPPRVVRPFDSTPSVQPAGELISTVGDLSRLAAALMNDGVLEGQRVLPPGLLDELARPRGRGAPLAGGERAYGLGLASRTHAGELVLEHEGVYGGFGASFLMVPGRRVAAIAVTNGRYSAPALGTQAAGELMLGRDPVIAAPRYVPIPAADSARAVGRYAALGAPVELRAVDGRLSFVTARGEAYPIVARAEGHWEIPDFPPYRPLPAAPLEIVSEPGGEVGFIRLAWRIYEREPGS